MNMFFVIRNTELNKLVTDGLRVPLNFKTFMQARKWLHLNGNPEYLTVVSCRAQFYPAEREQLLKVNFQSD